MAGVLALTVVFFAAGCACEWRSLFAPAARQPAKREKAHISTQTLARDGLQRWLPAHPQPATTPQSPTVPRLIPDEVGPSIKIERQPSTPPSPSPAPSTPSPSAEVMTPESDAGAEQPTNAAIEPAGNADSAGHDQDGLESQPRWRCETWGAGAEIAVSDGAPLGGSGKILQTRFAAGAARDKDKTAISLASPGAGSWLKARQIVLDAHLAGAEEASLAIAVALGEQRIYYESKCRRLQKGWNRGLRYALDEASWKSAASRWEHDEAVPQAEVAQILLLIYNPAPDAIASFDNIRVLEARVAPQ